MQYFTSHVICCTRYASAVLELTYKTELGGQLQLLSGKIMFVGSLMIATQAVCGGMLSRSVSVTK